MASRKKKSSDDSDPSKSYYKNNFKGQILPGKQLIMNVFSTLCDKNPSESLNNIAKKTAEMTGVSVMSVWRAKREFGECGGKFPSIVVKRPNAVGKKSRIKKYDEASLTGIKQKVNEFLSRNEIPTRAKLMESVNGDNNLPNFNSLRTFERLIKDMGFDSKYKLHKIKCPVIIKPFVTPKKHTTPFVRPILKPKLLDIPLSLGDDLSAVTIENNPYEVKKTPLELFLHSEVVYREDFLVLYASNTAILNKQVALLYEMVVHKDIWQSAHPCATYSLFRTEDKPEAIGLFLLLKQVLPVFMACTPELITRDNLQELCDAARRKPTWNPAHIAAHLGWIDCFKHEIIAKQINDTCPETMMSPLHLAIEGQRLPVVQTLVNLDVRLDLTDKRGYTIYHYAANTNKDIIQALVSWETPPLINKRNLEGQTPLHIACLTNNPECVRELLRSGADANVTGLNDQPPLQSAVEASNALCAKEILDMYPGQFYNEVLKSGGTPLHWARTTHCLESLIEFGCHLNAKNYQGDTALHVMVKRNCLPCVLTLLSFGANPDLLGSDGNAPIHIAVLMGDTALVQALTIFDANPNLPNAEGYSPRHLAASAIFPTKDCVLYVLHTVGAKRCLNLSPSCLRGCVLNGDLNGVPPEKISRLGIPKLYDGLLGLAAVATALSKKESLNLNHPANTTSTRHPCRVLCLDGGGTRALVLIQALAALEATLGGPVMKHFDWVTGTGTGGLLAVALALGKSVRECRGLFFKLCQKSGIGLHSESEILENFFRKIFGDGLVMSDIKFGKVILLGVLENLGQPSELHMYRNYVAPAMILGQNMENCLDFLGQPIWQVAKALCSNLMHSGANHFDNESLVANNPTLDALTEIHERNLALKATNQESKTETIDVIVSLGCGVLPRKTDTPNQQMIDKITQSESRVVERAQAWCSMIGVPHFRLNPPLSENVAADETDGQTLIRALWETTVYLGSRKTELLELAMLLKQ